ncbi:MAG: hypothetical protein ACRDS1_12520 [Pseudonocardiaceae bacterium]
MDRLVGKDVKDNVFDVVLRGYDKRQVDERQRIVDAELSAARYALRAAQERIASLENEVNRARCGGDLHLESSFGARVEKILILAEEQAREVRGQADQAAAALERESQRVRTQAQTEAEQTRKAVAQQADELLKTARRDADEVGKAARVEAAQLVAHARAEANRLVSTAAEQAQQRERASAHELYQLSRLHDEINGDLYRAKEVLDGLFGTTRPILRATSMPVPSVASPTVTAAGPKRPMERHQARTV